MRADRFFAPLLEGKQVVIPPGRHTGIRAAQVSAYSFAARHRFKVRTCALPDGFLMVIPATKPPRRSPLAARLHRLGGPAHSDLVPVLEQHWAKLRRRYRRRDDGPFDAEADRLDELADLSALHLQAKTR